LHAKASNAGPRNVKDFDRILKAAVETDFAQSIPYLSAEIADAFSEAGERTWSCPERTPSSAALRSARYDRRSGSSLGSVTTCESISWSCCLRWDTVGAHPPVVTVEQVNGVIFDARRKGKHGRIIRRGARIPGRRVYGIWRRVRPCGLEGFRSGGDGLFRFARSAVGGHFDSSIAAGRSTVVAGGCVSQWEERQRAVVRCSKHAGTVGASGKYRKEGQNGKTQSQ
jgi:hypothetical protein